MTTLKKLYEIHALVQTGVALFGCTEEFGENYMNQFSEIGKTLITELDLSPEAVKLLPHETELPPQTETKLQNFRKWLAQQRTGFTKQLL